MLRVGFFLLKSLRVTRHEEMINLDEVITVSIKPRYIAFWRFTPKYKLGLSSVVRFENREAEDKSFFKILTLIVVNWTKQKVRFVPTNKSSRL